MSPLLPLLALLLCLVHNTAAVPTLRTYRGVSPYEALADGGLHPGEGGVQSFIAFYQNKSPKTSWQQASLYHDDDRPEWAQSIFDSVRRVTGKVLRLTGGFGTDLANLFDLVDSAIKSTAVHDFTEAKHTWSSLDPATGQTVILPNGTVVGKGKNGLPDLSRVDNGAFDYANTPVRGVNIGNWLVAEFWMDPLYAKALNDHAINAPNPNSIVDEWTAGKYSDYRYQEEVFKDHYESWFGEDDMRQIAEAGLNHVRIPIGYWAFGETNRRNEPYRTFNQYEKLIQACNWAKKYKLKVWIDLHGVPGSQNGFDNSGRSGPIHWTKSEDNIQRTMYAFDRLIKTFNNEAWRDTVTAFEAVNEPQGHNGDVLYLLQNRYYPWSLGDVKRNALPSQLQVTHDAFLTPGYWEKYYSRADAKRVILDNHPYFIYTPAERNMPDSGRIREMCDMRKVYRRSKKYYVTVAGEMTTASPQGDNGKFRDLPDKFGFKDDRKAPYSKEYRNWLAFSFRVQQSVFEEGNGWIYWAWYNKQNLDWSYKTGVQWGWLPRNAQEMDQKPLGTADEACRIVGR